MRRRQLLLVAATMAVPVLARAQPRNRQIRIGILSNFPAVTPEAMAIRNAFEEELRRLGWSEERNLRIERRYAEGSPERNLQNARELVALKVDLLVAPTGLAADAAKKSTQSIPVVFATVPNPVETGLVASLARPGGNLTGLSSQGLDLIGKRFELLKEAFPRIARVGYLPAPAYVSPMNERAQRSAESLKLQLLTADLKHPGDLAGAIEALTGVDAWFVAEVSRYYASRKAIVDAIARHRSPAMYPSELFVGAGGLMSYSENIAEQFRLVARLIDRILRGAKPADIPVEQPTRLNLTLNLKTARALGLTIPQSVLLRATEVIE